MKKYFNKTLSFILVLTLVLGLFSGLSFNSSAADLLSSGSCGTNVNYTFDSESGTLTISGTGAMGDYYSSYSPFYKQTRILHIIIKSSVTSIGRGAFYNCSELKSIDIPDSVTSIGNYAFCGCSSLTSITIPDSVTSIGDSAFYNCRSLKKVNIISIEAWCNIRFDYNPLLNAHNLYLNGKLLTDLVIPDSVTSIGSSAFYGCTGLKSVTISNSVTSIGDSAFSYCSGLTRVTIPDSVTSIGDYAFDGCNGLTGITIPDSVTSIGVSAFGGCTGLTGITIPDSVTSIGDYAFYGCSGLKELIMPCSAKLYNSFGNCTNIEKVILTKGTGTMQDYGTSTSSSASVTYYQYTPWYVSRDKIRKIIIEDGVESIGSYAFKDCNGLTSITIPDSVTSIGEGPFASCNNLISMTVSENNKSYDSRNNCNAIIKTKTNTLIQGCKNTIIPDSITNIGNFAFYGCSGLKSVKLPDSVTSIGYSAFYDCSALRSITIPNSVTGIDGYAFYECIRLTNITIPDSVTSIGSCAFYCCSGLKEITMPASTEIGLAPFPGCTNIEKVTLTKGTGAMHNYNNLSNKFSFYQYTPWYVSRNNMKELIIEDGIESIGSYAFKDCNGLTIITIPDSVTSIGASAFNACSGLTIIDIKGNNCSIYNSADTLPENATIVINGSKGVYDYAVKYNRNHICNHVEITDEAKVPTCLETGLTQGKHCNICGEVLIKQENVNSLGHTPAEPVRENEVAPTCTKTGSYYEVVYCSVCGEQISREKKTISKLPHTPAEAVRENEIAPTCAKTGSYDEVVYCSVCKGQISRQKKSIPKLPHTPADEPVRRNETAPTCTKDGSYDDVIYCTVCKQEISRQTKPIKKLGHDLKTVETIAPTYTEEGYDILQCQRAGCNYSCYGNYVPATLASISVSLKEPISLLERADATRYDRTDLAAMHQYGEVYYEYEYSIFKPGNAITLTATNGTKEVFTYSEDTGEFMNAKGEGIYPEVTDTQSEITPWTVGTNYFTVSYGNKSVNVPVTIRKNPIVQIVFIPNNPYIYTQYAEGDWDTYRASEFDAPVRYFRYDLPTFKTGDRLAVSYDDGVLQYNTDYTYDETKKAFVSATGESIPDSEVKCGYSGGNCLDWTIGERGGWFEFAYLGCTSYAAVKIRENYVQSIAFTPVKPYEVIEGNSKEHFVKWDEKTETYIEGDYYDAFDIYVPGNQLTVNYKNSSSDTFICKQTSEGLVFANAGGETISPKSVSNQYQKPWTLGSNNTFTVKWSGAQVSVPVTMVESPISDIAYNPAKPIVLVENTGGYYRDNDWYQGKVFFYDNPLFKEGDELILYYKTGATKKYTAKFVNGKVDFYDSVGNLLEGILWVDDNYQYEFPWQLGDYNDCIVKYMGQSASVLVSVVKKHTYVAKKTAATAVNVGFTEYICSDCGEYKKDAKGDVIKDKFTAPTGKLTLKHSARTANAIKVQWNNVKTASGYQVQISTKDGKKWSTSATLKAGVTNYTFKKLVAGNNYKFRVRFYIKAADGKNYFSPWSATLNSPTLPTGTTLTKLSPSSKAFTAQWKKGACTGYQLQYATNAKFTGAKAVTIKNVKTLKYAVKKLSAKKTYYVRVRTYKTISGKNYYSTWSGAKAVKTK